ncbi:hypothetical protein BUALT_Bualt06G0021600 [Buddleja alternifolia]|uniref:Uncharacterized protein n=2 Tax=Pentapetalae TaxID=1437201 RepID=A0AAV6XJC6_9LAMI|nr:hypothetical protein BUALT_Bualt06G0021600 [Buddleja alternifolia]
MPKRTSSQVGFDFGRAWASVGKDMGSPPMTVSGAKMVPKLGITRQVSCYCWRMWASSRRENKRVVPMSRLSERCASWLIARNDGIPWAWGAQVSSAKVVLTLGIARRFGCYCGLVWASSRQENELAVPMGSLSERCASWLFAHNDGIPWAWGPQVLSTKMVTILGITRRFDCYYGLVWASSRRGNEGTRLAQLAKTSHFRLVGPRCGLDLKAFAVQHVLRKCLRTCLACWLMESYSISQIWNSEWVRGPRALFAPKTSVRRFVRTTVIFILIGSMWLGSYEIGVDEECYLVDPTSIHMLVSKIKPCMYKRSTRALPVAAMIHDNSMDRTALVPGSTDVAYRTSPAPYEKSKSLGFGGRMVTRLKLKGIDGRALPGVEPAA